MSVDAAQLACRAVSAGTRRVEPRFASHLVGGRVHSRRKYGGAGRACPAERPASTSLARMSVDGSGKVVYFLHMDRAKLRERATTYLDHAEFRVK